MTRRTARALVLAPWVLAALYAPPALARVEDPLGLLGDGVAAAVETGIANLGAGEIDVAVVPRAGSDAPMMAEQLFKGRGKGPRGGVIIVSAKGGKPGVFLGADFAAHGVDAALVDRLIARAYQPEADRDMPSDGVLALVRQLKLARTLGRDPAITPAAPEPRVRIPGWVYLLPFAGLAAGLGVVAGRRALRRRRRRERLEDLLDRLENQRHTLRRMGDRLTSIPPGGPPSVTERAQALASLQGDLNGDLDGVDRELKRGHWEEADVALLDLAPRLRAQEVAIAGAVTAAQSGPAALDAAAAAYTRWLSLDAHQTAWAREAGPALAGPRQLADRLATLLVLLATPPVDYPAAAELLDATEALYRRTPGAAARATSTDLP